MPAGDWANVGVQVAAIVGTLIGCSFWIGGKLSGISQQLKELVAWRLEVTSDNKSLWVRLDEHGRRLDEQGLLIAEHGVQIVGIKERCRDQHGRKL